MQNTNDKTPVKAMDSASALIIRDGDAHSEYGRLEILMVRRHRDIKFAGGAYVFPGGKTDLADKNIEENDLNFQVTTPYEDIFKGQYYACIREIFEEVGLLLGVELDQQKDLEEKYRSSLLQGDINFTDFLTKTGLSFDPDLLQPFAHWVTPDHLSKRFDTRFFLCHAPYGQTAVPDGSEIVDARWMKPLQVLKEAAGDLMFPTMMNLKMLSQSNTVKQAFETLKSRKIITVKPTVVKGKEGSYRVIDKNAGYEDMDQSKVRSGLRGES